MPNDYSDPIKASANDYLDPSETTYAVRVEGNTYDSERKRVVKQTQCFTELTEQQKNDILGWAVKNYLHGTLITVTHGEQTEIQRIVFKRAKKTVEKF